VFRSQLISRYLTDLVLAFDTNSTQQKDKPHDDDDDDSKSYVRPLLQLETVTSMLVIRSGK